MASNRDDEKKVEPVGPAMPAAVAEVVDASPPFSKADKKQDRKVDFGSADERRIANASPEVKGGGGIEITAHKKVRLANGILIENF